MWRIHSAYPELIALRRADFWGSGSREAMTIGALALVISKLAAPLNLRLPRA
jgi:hypothetical protein